MLIEKIFVINLFRFARSLGQCSRIGGCWDV